MHEFAGLNHENIHTLRVWQITALLAFLEELHKGKNQ